MTLRLPNILVILSVLIFTLSEGAKKDTPPSSQQVTFGTQAPRELHLGRFTATENFKRMRVITKDFVYKPTPGNPNYSRTITRIVVSDQYKNGKGGVAKLKDGGPSSNFAVLALKSQRNHGYNFIIDIYGI